MLATNSMLTAATVAAFVDTLGVSSTSSSSCEVRHRAFGQQQELKELHPAGKMTAAQDTSTAAAPAPVPSAHSVRVEAPTHTHDTSIVRGSSTAAGPPAGVTAADEAGDGAAAATSTATGGVCQWLVSVDVACSRILAETFIPPRQKGPLYYASKAATHSADWKLCVLIPGLFFVFLASSRAFVVTMYIMLALAWLTFKPVKRLVRRRRPYYGPKPTSPNSFPSGHTSRAIAVAWMLTLGVDGTPWLAALYFGWAGSIMVSRVLLKEHHIGDTLAAAVFVTTVVAIMYAIGCVPVCNGVLVDWVAKVPVLVW